MAERKPWRLLADGALRQYPLANPHVEFIRHNENISCKVRDGNTGQQYVLRVHKPIQGFASAQHSYSALEAEMQFLTAIGKGTDIGVQKPVRNYKGNTVTQVREQEEIINATLLTWVEGRTMHHEDPNWEEEAYAAGVMMAKMHDFAACWRPEQPPLRHHYDQRKAEAVSAKISEGVALNLFSTEQMEIVGAGAEKIIAFMNELDARPLPAKGMIHADLSKGNLIVSGDKVIPIDFCLCGYGYFLMDLGGISADFGPLNVRRAMLTGYRSIRDLPEEDLKYIEGFFIFSILLFMAGHLNNPKVWEWFGRRMQPICDDYIIPFLEDRSFYDTI